MYAQLVESLLYPEREGLGVPSLREAAPGVPVLGNAISARSNAWTTASMQYLREHNVQIDGAVIHPYVSYPNGCPGTEGKTGAGPQVAVNCIVTVSDEIARDYGQRLPMWVTEVGWSRAGGRAVTADVQAQYLVEMYVRSRATGMVRGVWWYDLQDDIHTNDVSEMNFGLMGRDPSDQARPGALHPSGEAFSALAHFWAGCASVDGAYKDNRTFQVPCADGTRQIILAATADELAQASATGATLVDLLGQQADVAPGGDVAPLVGHPVGVTSVGPPPAVPAEPDPTEDVPPAPSAPDDPAPEATTPTPEKTTEPTPTVTPAPSPSDPNPEKGRNWLTLILTLLQRW
jgi:hypothetical protein